MREKRIADVIGQIKLPDYNGEEESIKKIIIESILSVVIAVPCSVFGVWLAAMLMKAIM